MTHRCLPLCPQLEHQAESGRLSLQGLWFYVQPAAGPLALLAALVARIEDEGVAGAGLPGSVACHGCSSCSTTSP